MGTCQSTVDKPLGLSRDFDNPIKLADAISKRQRRSRDRISGKLLVFPNRKACTSTLISPTEQTEMTFPETPLFGVEKEKQNRSRFSFERSPRQRLSTVTFPESSLEKEHRERNYSIVDSKAKEIQNELSENEVLDDATSEGVGMGQPPLVAPPKRRRLPSSKSKSSVDPQTLASFNRMKTQVELAEKQEILRRRKAKVEDRVEDLKGYRSLWKTYEEIQQQVHCQQQCKEHGVNSPSANTMSMDLQEPTSWYFDFHALKVQRHFQGDDFKIPRFDDETRSQTSISLLSEISLDAQRKYYHLKSRERIQNSERNAFAGGSGKHRNQNNTDDDRSYISASSGLSSRSTIYLRGKTNTNAGDYGPIQMPTNGVTFNELSGERSIGANDIISRGTSAGVETDENTNRVTRVKGASNYIESELDNDYSVSRHNYCQHCHTDESLHNTNDVASPEMGDRSTVKPDTNALESNARVQQTSRPQTFQTGEGRSVKNSFDGVLALRSLSSDVEGSVSKVSVPSPHKSRVENYGFDPSAPLSSQLELFAQTIPSVQIDDAKTGVVRWRKFSPTENANSKTARCLDEMFASGKNECTKSSRAEDADAEVVAGSMYDVMSPDQFLMMSSFHNASDHDDNRNLIQDDETSNSTDQGKGKLAVREGKFTERENETSSSTSTKSKKKSYDSVISTMSTEDFLRMSSWQNRVAHLDLVPIATPERSTQSKRDVEGKDDCDSLNIPASEHEQPSVVDPDPLAQIFLNAPDDDQLAKGRKSEKAASMQASPAHPGRTTPSKTEVIDSHSQSSKSVHQRTKLYKKQVSLSGKAHCKRGGLKAKQDDDPLTQIFLEAPGDDQQPNKVSKNTMASPDMSAEVSEAVDNLLSKFRADSKAIQ